jgi:hypothetical protein
MAAPKPNPATKATSDHMAKTFTIRIPIFASLAQLEPALDMAQQEPNKSHHEISLNPANANK